MSVYVRNLTINTHSDFSENLELYQVGGKKTNITGYTLYSHMRKHPDSTSHTTFNVGITSAADGEINVSLADTVTATLKPGRYVYDLLVERPNGNIEVILEGMVSVRAGMSHNCP